MATEDLIAELRTTAAELRAAVETGKAEAVVGPLDRQERAAERMGQAWSGSNIGYHARVYYAGFEQPPVGAFWSPEWGSTGVFSQASVGDWREFDRADIAKAIDLLADGASFDPADAVAKEAEQVLDQARSTIVSVLVTRLDGREDAYLRRIKDDVETIARLTVRQGLAVMLPRGSIMSRDSRAINGGVESAVHQEVIAHVVSVRSCFHACERMATLADQAAAHIERQSTRREQGPQRPGDRVFIGHGRSTLWREVKDYVEERLDLPTDEFNRVPVAGVTNTARLSQMLDEAGVAFLILTGEDEQADGEFVARQNVVHEAGLFQGRLGFTRAILVVEETCKQFSNIEGLGHISFPKGNISVAFDQIRQVLEREGLIKS